MATIKKYNGSTWENAVVRKYGTASEIIVPPTTIYTNGQPISTYSIKGNTTQSGTSTPTNPVSVNGTGDRTKNLFDKDRTAGIIPNAYINQSGQQLQSQNYYLSYPLSVESNAVYTWNFNSEAGANHTAPTVAFYDSSDNMLGVATHDSAIYHFTFTTPVNCAYIRASVFIGLNMTTGMLLEGSVSVADNRVIPFIPYGFKIPISSANTTTPVYLGEVETTRKIKKLVLDGTESWVMSAYTDANRFTLNSFPNDGVPLTGTISTHFIFDGYKSAGGTAGTITGTDSTTLYRMYIWSSETSVTAFKTWLAQQYAAGTPVTIWYVLAEPTTGTVNEPLMKIGDYADSISNTTAIPTTDGANSITVDTTVQPSEFTATWTGWHDSSVKEYDGSDWQ